MAANRNALPPLRGDQRQASDPAAHVWLSASAGTGKTQVLSARVFRLLLAGVDPAAILCLTFTKAGAAEMAGRISERLARWVRLSPTELSADLAALGELPTPPLHARARTLFAKVLDAPGGGIRIQTIHGFCQSLLAAFPIEAGLAPGFRPIEPREESLLLRETLAALLVAAEREGRAAPRATIAALSLRLGERDTEDFLRECAGALPALEALPSGIGPAIRRALDLPAGDIEAAIREGCAGIDDDALASLAAANRAWGGKKGLERADAIDRWFATDPRDAEALRALHGVWAKADGALRSMGKGQAPPDPAYAETATALHGRCAELLGLRERAAFADLLADALTLGRDYARAYAETKRAAGLVDFDDLIAATVSLLRQPGIGEWVRFKLDRTTEHVLIDEAQDTNLEQWAIVESIVDEYFVGRGIFAPSMRTLFTVGDFKQAIFGFQGTDPAFFRDMEGRFARRAEDARGDEDMPDEDRGLPFRRLSLDSSFRSTAPVLEFVDAAIGALGRDALGEVGDPAAHVSEVPGPGWVELWPPVSIAAAPEDDEPEADDDEQWVDDAVRRSARLIARNIRRWLDEGEMLGGAQRPIAPGDIMILVKRRSELAQLLVARLYAEGVPVAGVDRLRLSAPLAVQDLLAAVRFVLQPADDLSLASLLVSPLIGWSQEDLLTRAVPRAGPLWPHLRRTCAGLLAPLEAMLARADFVAPYQFLEEILSGPLGGRRRLLARLGEEARDPIEELLNAALEFEATATPSLQRFLDWFDRGEAEVKREAETGGGAVRVMTAHGAKGLQAPVVILADATIDPDKAPRRLLRWSPGDGLPPVPILRPGAGESGPVLKPVIERAAARDLEEHWRLFYVAATRAEERLVIAGALTASRRSVPERSWHAAAARGLDALAAAHPGSVVEAPDPDGGMPHRLFAGSAPARAAPRKPIGASPAPAAPLPGWAHRAAPAEARPPRPLAPSALGEDAVADPPPGAALRAAAERGRLIHALFERLPAVAPADRAAAADAWLARAQGVADAAQRAALAGAALRIIADDRFAAIFGADALAEVPVSAVLADGTVVAGTVDRLLVTDGQVTVVDFKSGRRAPSTLAEVPEWHVRQMAAYAAALAVIFPGHAVEATLIYTAGPIAHVLPADLLAAKKPGLGAGEQSLPGER